MDISPITIELDSGYLGPDQVSHRDVTFGRRIIGSDLFALDNDPLAEIPTQRQDLIISRAITKFGSLTLPVPLNVLQGLYRNERRRIIESYNRFAIESAGDRRSDLSSIGKPILAFGFKREGLIYDVATFGNRLTGHADTQADLEGLSGLSRACFLVGKEIVQLSQSNGTCKLDGAVELEEFEDLDAADIYTLIAASEAWNESFFFPRATVQGERGRDDSIHAGVGHRVERAADSQHDSREA